MTFSRRTAMKVVAGAGGVSLAGGPAVAAGSQETDGESQETDETGDEDAAVRIAHFSPDAPAVDVLVDGDRLFSDVAYGTVTPYVDVPPGTYTVEIAAADDAGEDTAVSDEVAEDATGPDGGDETGDHVVFEDEVTVEAGYYTAAAIGVLAPGREDRPGVGRQALDREFAVVVFADGETAGDGVRTSAGEPTDVPADANCPVCNMVPARYPDWNAQALHDDGERAYFCTSGCMTAYYVVPDQFADTDAPIAGVWVTDVETRETIDGFAAAYVLETDAERLDDPMIRNPVPFADRSDALAYVDQHDDLDESDVVTIDEFDLEVAETYRSRELEAD